MALQDMDFKPPSSAKDAVFGWNVTMACGQRAKIGPMALDSFSLREDVSRIDVEAVRLFQQALVGAYRARRRPMPAAFAPGRRGWPPWPRLRRLLAALPAYAVEIKATVGARKAA